MYRSQNDFPLSDVAIMTMFVSGYGTYTIPIGPNLLMSGTLPEHLNNHITATTIERRDMSVEVSERIIDGICSSAQISLISKAKISDVKDRIERGKRIFKFNSVKQPKDILDLGKTNFVTGSALMSVTKATYDKIISQFTEK